MSSRKLVICDGDEKYIAKLAAFLNGKKELAFQVNIYSSLEKMQKAEKENSESILLLNESFLVNDVMNRWDGKILILSEKRSIETYGKWKVIFKYQSCSKFMTQLLECCEEEMKEIWHVRKGRSGKMIGIYSPVHRIGQTSFALKKAKELSKERNVLYMNLETYAGYGSIFPFEDEKTMSTLLYYAKQESSSVGFILTTLIKTKDGIDYVPPALLSEDIMTMTKKEWLWLFQEILHNSIYDVLVLDLSESVQGLYDILTFCETVYMPVADDRFAAAKIKQYEDNLRRTGREELVERMVRCDIRGTAAGKNIK